MPYGFRSGPVGSPVILSHRGKTPVLAPDAFVAPTATLIGYVEIGAQASVWFGAILRADKGHIVIGRGSNVQDNVLIHTPAGGEALIENNVTIGHGAVLEGCVIKRGALVGMNAVVMRDAVVGAGSLVGAGAVVSEGMQVPPGTLVAGVPATVKKELSGSSHDWIDGAAAHYRSLAREYMEEG
jgi:carbonic anhydrase/acetyltransferase-like protein (isoleucine patch superfamily)